MEAESNRALDAAVAERVMGCRPVLSFDGFACCCNRPDANGHDIGEHSNSRLTGHGCNEIPFYSRDIAAAFLVVEEMRRRGWYMVLENHPGDRYSADFVTIHDGFTEWGDSAPECIVRAALAATKEAPPP